MSQRGFFGALFAAALAVYVAGLAPGPFWLDSSELAAAAWQLGVAHPPGHPLFALVGKAVSLVPLGSIAMRVGLASAICAALALLRVAQLVALLGARVGAPPSLTRALTLATLLLYGGGYAFAAQAVRAEVYALGSLLTLSTLVALLRFDAERRRADALAAALWAGLALGNHPLMAAAVALPGALWFVARLYGAREPARRGALLGWMALAGVATLPLFVYLPLRAAAHPLVDWGAPSTPARFWWTVSARAFARSIERGEAGAASELLTALGVQLRGVGVLLAFVGVWLAWRVARWRLRAPLLLLLGVITLQLAARASIGFDWANPDAYAYFGDALAAACVLATLPLFALGARRGVALAATAILALGALGAGVIEGRRWWLARHDDVPLVVGAWLGRMPPRALVVTSYFQTAFALWYLRGVEGARPDVDHLHRHFLGYPGYGDDEARRAPALAPLARARDVDAAALLAWPSARVIEYDLDLPAALVPASQAVPAPATPPSAEEQTRRFLGWNAFLAAHRACRLDDPAAQRAALDAARAQFGDDPDLRELARRCLR